MSSRYWHNINESSFPWERDALDFIRQRFPEREPYRAWQLFEFIADDGSINEVDLLVLTPVGFEHEGRLFTDDNPVIAANRKAKKLKTLPGRAAVSLYHGPAFRSFRKCSKNRYICSFDSSVGEWAGRFVMATRFSRPKRRFTAIE